MNGNGRKQQQLAHRAGADGREGLVKRQLIPVLSLRNGPNTFTLRRSGRSLTGIFDFKFGRSFAPLQKSRHLKSRFFCVNKSLILYGFRVGATGKSYKLLSGMYCEHSLHSLMLQFNARNVFS